MKRIIVVAAFVVAASLPVTTSAAPPAGRDGAFNFRFGGFFPTGSSDFWNYQETYYTFDHSDLNGFTGGVGYNGSINNYLEFDANADWYVASTRSADGQYTDIDGFPILHDRRLATYPLTVGLRVIPGGRFARRGAEGKHYVRHPVFYLGGGIGMAYWQYEEEGDFVFSDPTPTDPNAVSIFYDRAVDTGLEFQTYAMIGMEFPVSPQWNITFEVRHTWSEASVNEFFPSTALGPGFPNQLDLGGTSLVVGGSLRF